MTHRGKHVMQGSCKCLALSSLQSGLQLAAKAEAVSQQSQHSLCLLHLLLQLLLQVLL